MAVVASPPMPLAMTGLVVRSVRPCCRDRRQCPSRMLQRQRSMPIADAHKLDVRHACRHVPELCNTLQRTHAHVVHHDPTSWVIYGISLAEGSYAWLACLGA